jgi:hypothetical protein
MAKGAKMTHFHWLVGGLSSMVLFVVIQLVRLIASNRKIDITDTIIGAITIGGTFYILGLLWTRVFSRYF